MIQWGNPWFGEALNRKALGTQWVWIACARLYETYVSGAAWL